ncbi:MAG: universal stress protein, partial [Gemmataceae bacterium]
MYRSIHVPLDGSTFAEQALPLGIALTKRCGGRLLLVTVSTPMAEAYVEGMYFSTLELEQEMAGRHEAYLKKISERIQKLHPIPVQTSVQHGEVAATLVDLMGRGDADLAVMATHGRGALSRFWLGSVADEMVRETHVPMILIRPDEETPDLSKEPNLSKIVIPLDGTELAEQVLDHAVRLARVVPGAKIVLMRAINALIPVDMAPDVPEAER